MFYNITRWRENLRNVPSDFIYRKRVLVYLLNTYTQAKGWSHKYMYIRKEKCRLKFKSIILYRHELHNNRL